MMPIASNDCPFMFEEVTADFQAASIQGRSLAALLTAQITQPVDVG